jgi:NAD(P)-dependent dehydrogenase (short-subunit alcohol dehydrogenase family)
MRKDSDLRDDDANPTRGEASLGALKGSSRRQMLTATTLGAVSMAASSLLGKSPAASQTVAEPDRDQALKNQELEGKTAFITGGARGFGLAIAEELAKAGANIMLYDIASPTLPNVQYALSSERDLEQAKVRIEALGARCLTFKGDVRDRDAQVRAMDQAVKAFGSLDIAVANAGISQAGAIEDFSSEDISTVFEINIGGAIKTTQAAVKFMKPQGSGRIIFIASALGRMGNELFPIYTPTKWAMIGFAKSAALSYGKFNILCNTIAPGLANTPLADNDFMLRKMMPGEPNPTFAMLSEMLRPGNPIPVGHVESVDVAKAVLFFAGSGTSKVTGEVFDLSYTAHWREVLHKSRTFSSCDAKKWIFHAAAITLIGCCVLSVSD